MDRDQRERTKEEESIDAYIVALHAMTTGILEYQGTEEDTTEGTSRTRCGS